VASRAPGTSAAEDEVIAHVRAQLAAYKAPKRVVWVDAVYRSPSGKSDYRWAREAATGG
jgi:acyl-CoA synthetase (AMP-forming)/AMP-acid ligase II